MHSHPVNPVIAIPLHLRRMGPIITLLLHSHPVNYVILVPFLYSELCHDSSGVFMVCHARNSSPVTLVWTLNYALTLVLHLLPVTSVTIHLFLL